MNALGRRACDGCPASCPLRCWPLPPERTTLFAYGAFQVAVLPVCMMFGISHRNRGSRFVLLLGYFAYYGIVMMALDDPALHFGDSTGMLVGSIVCPANVSGMVPGLVLVCLRRSDDE